MTFKDISYFNSGGNFSVEQKCLCNFGSEHYYEHFCETIIILRPVFKEEMPSKNISIFSSGGHFVQQSRAERFGQFGTGFYEEHFCKTTLLKIFKGTPDNLS